MAIIRQVFAAENAGGGRREVRRLSEQDNATVKIRCDKSEIEEAKRKAERLVELLKEANALVDELASKKIRLEMDI